MELSEILYNKAEYIETVFLFFLNSTVTQLAIWLTTS